MTTVIASEGLSIDYKLPQGWVNVINDISFSIPAGEIHGLVGESGSGKSTLGLALMGYLAPNARVSAGQVMFDGLNLIVQPTRVLRALWGKQIALVPQDALASLNPAYTVGEQIAEVVRRHDNAKPADAWARTLDALRRVRLPDPESAAKRYPHQLSGGQQQRVTIAMALITRPRLLILDEPTTALDVTTEAAIVDLIRELIDEVGAAALYISHNLGLVASLCDRVTVLYAGEIMASGATVDLFKRPLHPYTISLLASLPRPTTGTETRLPTIDGIAPSLAERPSGCVFAPRCAAASALCHAEKPPLEMLDNQRMIKCHRWREIAAGAVSLATAPQSRQPETADQISEGYVLTTRNIAKTFDAPSLLDRAFGRDKGVRALADTAIRVRRRSTLGVVGESGSGKTTLARCIVGLTTADMGEIELLDVPLNLRLNRRPRAALRAMQMVFQNPNDALNPYRSVGAALARSIQRLSAAPMSAEQVATRVSDLLTAVRLTPDYAQRYPSELSGGEKQRVAIARAFAADPALVVADEPTSALDASVQSVVLNLLKDLRAANGVSYLFISHDLRAISYLADWIIVMYLGQIVEEGTAEHVQSTPSHPYTEALLSAIPDIDPTAPRKHIRLEGEPPNPRAIPHGCRFHTRCPRKIGAICETDAPPYREAGDGHFIRCHIPVNELAMLQSQPKRPTPIVEERL